MFLPYSEKKIIGLYKLALLEYKLAYSQEELDISRNAMSNLEGVALEFYGESLFGKLQSLKKNIVM